MSSSTSTTTTTTTTVLSAPDATASLSRADLSAPDSPDVVTASPASPLIADDDSDSESILDLRSLFEDDVVVLDSEPAPVQKTKGASLGSKMAKLSAIANMAWHFNSPEPHDDVMSRTMDLIEKGRTVFRDWWAKIWEFFKSCTDKVKDSVATIYDYLRTFIKAVIEFIGDSWNSASKWFKSMTTVTGEEYAPPPSIVPQRPLHLSETVAMGDVAFGTFFSTNFPDVRTLHAWLLTVCKTYAGKDIPSHEFRLFEIGLGIYLVSIKNDQTTPWFSPVLVPTFVETARSSPYMQGEFEFPYTTQHSFPYVSSCSVDSVRFPYAAFLQTAPMQSQISWLSFLSLSELINLLTTLSASIIGGLKAGTQFFESLSAEAFSAAFTSFLASYNNFKRSGLGDTIEWFVDKVVHFLTGCTFSERYSMKRRWDASVEQLNADLRTASTARNLSPIVAARIASTIADLEDMFACYIHFFPREQSVIRSQYDDLRRRSAQFDSGTVPSHRHKPVVVVLNGKAGVGKTATQKAIIDNTLRLAVAAASSKTSKDTDVEALKVLAKNPSHFPYNCAEIKCDFDDGYKNQPFVTFEELGSISDSEVNKGWVSKFFRVADREPLLLNMAFADKGKRYMNSPFVIATSNSERFPGIHLFHEPDAMYRRIEFFLDVDHPANASFDLSKVTFSYRDEVLDILKNPRLSPSPTLSRMILQNVFNPKKFGVNELINAVAVVYLERLHSYVVPGSTDINLDGSFLNTAHNQFDGKDRDGKLSVAAVPEKYTSSIRRAEEGRQTLDCILSKELYDECLKLYNNQDLPNLLALLIDQPGFDKLTDLATRCNDKGSSASDRASLFLDTCNVFIAPNPTSGTPKYITNGWHFESTNIFIVFATVSMESQMNNSISWADDPDLHPSKDDRFLFCKCWTSYTLELMHYDPAAIRSEILNFKSKVHTMFITDTNSSDPYGLFDRMYASAVVTEVSSDPWKGLYCGFSKLTRTYPALRQRSLRTALSSTPQDKAKVIAGGMFVCKMIKWVLSNLSAVHRESTMVDEQFLFLKLNTSLGTAPLNDMQLRSLNYHLKFLGKRANVRGHVTPLPAHQLRAYELRQRQNAKRNETKNASRDAARARTQDKSMKSRADIDRRVNKRRDVGLRKARGYKVAMQSQGLSTSNCPEQVMAQIFNHHYNHQAEYAKARKLPYFSSFTFGEKLRVVDYRYNRAARYYLQQTPGVSVGDLDFVMNVLKTLFVHHLPEPACFTIMERLDMLQVFCQLLPHPAYSSSDIDQTIQEHIQSKIGHMQFRASSPVEVCKIVGAAYIGIIFQCSLDAAMKVYRYYSAGVAVESKHCPPFLDDAAVATALTAAATGFDKDPIKLHLKSRVLRASVDLCSVEVARIRERANTAEAVLASLTLVLTTGALGLLVSSLYTIYKALAKGSVLAEVNTEMANMATITEDELKMFEKRCEEAGICIGYSRKPGTDRIDIAPEFLYPQSAEPDPAQTPNPKRMKGKQMAEPSMTLQSGAPTSQMLFRIFSNMYAISVKLVDDTWLHIADLTFVESKVALMPCHVYKALCAMKSPVRFDPHVSCPTRKSFLLSNVVQGTKLLTDEDGISNDKVLVLFKSPQLCPHSDIKKYFLTEEERKRTSQFVDSGFMLGFDSNYEQHLGIFSGCAPSENYVHVNSQWVTLTSPHDVYHYADAKSSSCGRLQLIEYEGRIRIRGMHVMGSEKSRLGRAINVTSTWMSAAIEAMESQSSADEVYFLSFDLEDPVVEGAYTIDQDGIHTTVDTSALDTTNFIPTVFTDRQFDGGSPVTPTIMIEANYIQARDKEARRLACAHPHPDAWHIVTTFTYYLLALFMHFNPMEVVRGCCRLSFSEALDSHSSLNRFSATSARGIRLKCCGWKKPQILGYKNAAIGVDIPVDEDIRCKFEADLQSYLDEGDKHRNFPYQINFDKLKDETLLKALVALGKCRLFNITDFFDNVLMKISIGALVAKLDFLFITGPQSCGLNMRGNVARDIYQTFKGTVVLAFDVSGFDNTVNSIALPVIVYLIRCAYPNRVHRRWAYWTILSTYHSLRFNRRQGRYRGIGNTSGNWITTWLNTITNCVYFGVATIWLALKHGDDPIKAIADLRLRLYSDDNLSALDRPWYNPVNLKEAFDHLFHVELTNTDKSEVTNASVYSIDDAEFLSRTFRYDGGLVFCPLALPSLFGQLYYVRCPRNQPNRRRFILFQLEQNLNNVASELYEYPREEADAIATRIFLFLEKVKLPPSLFPYDYDFDRRAFKLTL